MLNKIIEMTIPADTALNCIRDVAKSYNPTFLYVNQIGQSVFFSSKSFSLFKYRIKKTMDSKMNNIITEICFCFSIKVVSNDKCEIHITADGYLGHSDNQGYLIEYLAEFMRRVEERLL